MDRTKFFSGKKQKFKNQSKNQSPDDTKKVGEESQGNCNNKCQHTFN